MSIRSFLVPKPQDIPDLEKVVPSSVAEAVRKEVGSDLVEKSGLTEEKGHIRTSLSSLSAQGAYLRGSS